MSSVGSPSPASSPNSSFEVESSVSSTAGRTATARPVEPPKPAPHAASASASPKSKPSGSFEASTSQRVESPKKASSKKVDQRASKRQSPPRARSPSTESVASTRSTSLPSTPAKASRRDFDRPGHDDDDDDMEANQSRTVRVLTAEQFKRLFQSDIAGLPEQLSRSPVRGRQPSPRPSTAPRSGRRPATASSHGGVSVRQSSTRRSGAVDPYAGTRYGPLMANPPHPPKTVSKLRKSVVLSAASRADLPDFGAASRQASPSRREPSRTRAGNASALGRADDEATLRLQEQLQAVTLQLKQKDQRVHQLLRQKGQLEQEVAQLATLKFHNAAAGGKTPADDIIRGLKARVSFLEEKLRVSEEDCQAVRHTTKALRVATLQEQAATYLAEVHRLRGLLKDHERHERTGLGGAALAEAQSVIASKDNELVQVRERNRSLKAQLRAAVTEAETCRETAATAREDATSMRRKMEELKDVPAEVLRLKMELQLAAERLEDARREVARLSGDKDAATQDIRTRDQSLDNALRERDSYRIEYEQLQLKLKAHDEAADAKIAKAVEAARKEAEEKITEAALFAKDREATLRADMRDQRDRIRELEGQLAKQAATHREEIEVLKVKEQQRQENMLRTMGAYDRDRQEQQTKAIRDAEQRVAAEREAFEREKQVWAAEAEDRRREMRRLEEEVEAARRNAERSLAEANARAATARAESRTHVRTDTAASLTPDSEAARGQNRSFTQARGRQDDLGSSNFPPSEGLGSSVVESPAAVAPRPSSTPNQGTASPSIQTLTQGMLPKDAASRYKHNDEVSEATIVRADHHRRAEEDTMRLSPTLENEPSEPRRDASLSASPSRPAQPDAPLAGSRSQSRSRSAHESPAEQHHQPARSTSAVQEQAAASHEPQPQAQQQESMRRTPPSAPKSPAPNHPSARNTPSVSHAASTHEAPAQQPDQKKSMSVSANNAATPTAPTPPQPHTPVVPVLPPTAEPRQEVSFSEGSPTTDGAAAIPAAGGSAGAAQNPVSSASASFALSGRRQSDMPARPAKSAEELGDFSEATDDKTGTFDVPPAKPAQADRPMSSASEGSSDQSSDSSGSSDDDEATFDVAPEPAAAAAAAEQRPAAPQRPTIPTVESDDVSSDSSVESFEA